MKNGVGPVLRMSQDIDSIIAAIREDNPDQEIEVTDRGAYVRVQAPRRMTISRIAVERNLGRPFEMQELELMLSAFSGRIKTTSDKIEWHYQLEEEPVG
jgi:toluene monooxygenase system protein D